MGVIIIREMVGTSPRSWSDAARQAVATASRTVRNIKTVEVVKSTAIVENNEIVEYRVDLKIGFEYEGYWGYDQRAEQVYQEYRGYYPPEVVQALACGWQLARQATNSKAYGMRQRLGQDAEFYFAYAATLLPEASEALRKEMVEALDAEVRSSSLIENVNSTLRPLLETCRGQVAQQMLDLFAYVHNHRRFVRGKRAGKAPIEILTGKEMAKTWLTSLLEAI